LAFKEVLNEVFPGAVEEAAFVSATARALRPRGFTGDSAIACVGTCRDEISQTLVEHVRAEWGEAFNLAGLAGMLFAGRTAFGAAQAHSPIVGGRERYVFFTLPHVAIGDDGEQGVVMREGRPEPSSACGALLALLGDLREGSLDTQLAPDDVEQSLLRARVGGRLASGVVPELFALTELVGDLILEDLERTVEATVDTVRADYAVLAGIQIHGPEGNYVQPRTMYTVVDRQRREIELARPE
jgi:hypothetical protein